MIKVNDVFKAAVSIADELNGAGEAITADNADYINRTPAIINALVGEYLTLTGESDMFRPVTSLDNVITGITASYALTVLPYGLAAHLLMIEDEATANFCQQRYEELRNLYSAKKGTASGEVEDVYSSANGGIEYGYFANW